MSIRNLFDMLGFNPFPRLPRIAPGDPMALTAAVYLEDLSVGDEFRSGEHALDEAQIVDFARQFDPSPSTPMARRPATPSSRAWPPAAGTPRRSR
jgi:hypothetical protein